MNPLSQRQGITPPSGVPLAARMRPRSLDEFVGQDHILGPGRLLRRAIQADQLSSLIFYGPPGTGKTTLAQIIANTTRAHFIAINAVLDGVKEIRGAIATAQQQQTRNQQRTILFVDEVHRFNKAQQDALLPWVENGTVILIGATTENPYFEVNKALVSRSRVFQLKSLNQADLERIAHQALSDRDRGYGNLSVQLLPAALEHLGNVANGDARALLNALELAVETTPPDPQGQIQITLEVAEESIQRRAVLYDKEGDAHFDTISAFIKSLRGSDPDAALYWLARMIYAGEDPRFLFRRMLILASEDVGLADPQAVVVVHACAAAFDRVGLPEGHYPLAQATLYLANAPKSNSIMGFFDALKAVQQQRETEVPAHLKDGSRDRQQFGHGAGYRYPHAYRDHWVAQQYLPENLQGQLFYQPSNQGQEGEMATQITRRREAQLAAMLEGGLAAPPEILSFSPKDPASDRWLQRTISQSGQRLGAVRDRLFGLLSLQRHHLVLDLNASSGLLTWEALRQVPEGGVYACTRTLEETQTLQELSQALPELRRPEILQTTLPDLPQLLQQKFPGLRFETVMGRNALTREPEKAAIARSLVTLLQPQGVLVLAETIPQQTQRLYRLVNPAALPAELWPRWAAAEEAIYRDPSDLGMNWHPADLQTLLETLGLSVTLQVETSRSPLHITPTLSDRWFRRHADPPSYADRLAPSLSAADLALVQELFQQHLNQQTVLWESAIAWVKAVKIGASSPRNQT